MNSDDDDGDGDDDDEVHNDCLRVVFQLKVALFDLAAEPNYGRPFFCSQIQQIFIFDHILRRPNTFSLHLSPPTGTRLFNTFLEVFHGKYFFFCFWELGPK